MKDIYKYELKTALPYCLNIKDDTYSIIYNKTEYLFKTSKIWASSAIGSDSFDDYEDDPNRKPIDFKFKTPEFSGSILDYTNKYTGKNIQYIEDDTDHFRLTVIEVFWESSKNYFNKEYDNNSKNTHFTMILKVLNSFIEIYRYVSGQFHLPLLKEIPYRNFSTLKNIETGVVNAFFSTNVKKAQYNIPKGEHSELKSLLINENFLDSTILSINSAKHWLSRSQFRNSIIDAIISLEPVIFSFIEQEWLKRGVSKNKTREQLDKIDLNHLMTIEIPNVIDIKKNNVKKIYEGVIKAISLRNKIIHKNFKDFSRENAEEAVDNIEKLIIIVDDKLKENKP